MRARSARPGPAQTSVRASDLAALGQALQVPDLAGTATHLAERARAEHWSYEEFLLACLEREVAARRSEEGEHDDNPLAPGTIGCPLPAEHDDNPLAPMKEIGLPPAPWAAGPVSASVGAP